MEPVILMVSRGNDPEVYDIEVMPDVPICDLADAIASAMQWQGTYDIEVSGTGKPLAPQQCLADAGVWDGARLRLTPSARPTRRMISVASQQGDAASQDQGVQTERAQAPDTGPVSEWKQIQTPDADSPTNTPAPAPPPSTPIVGWRQPSQQGNKKS